MQRESSKHSVKSLDFACAEDESHFRNSEGDDFIEDPWNWRSLTNSQIFLLKTGAIVGFGGFVFGYDIGVIAGINVILLSILFQSVFRSTFSFTRQIFT